MAFLKIMSGDLAGTKVDIDGTEITIGRAPENTIILNDIAVSSKHCAIRKDGKKYSVVDLGSTNGTRLNDGKVKEARLKPKDLVYAGAIEMMFDGAEVEIEPTARTTQTFVVEQGGSSSAAPTFDAKRDNKWALPAVIGLMIMVALAGVGFLVYKLFAE